MSRLESCCKPGSPFRFAKIPRSEIHSVTTATARSYISKIVPLFLPLFLSLSLTHSLLFLSLSNTLQNVLYRVVLQIPYFTDFFSLFSSLGLRKLKLSLFLFKVDCFFSVLGRVSVIRGTLDVYAPLDLHNRTV